jgi:glycosyltransferase involved in cell wall biosynthesis
MAAKINIAIIIPGGIGTGKSNMGVPVIEQLVKLLSKEFSITVFQLHRSNVDYIADGFELIDIPSENPVSTAISFILLFRKQHNEKNFKAIHGFWALPSGFLAVVAGKLFNLKSVISLQGGDAIALPEINYGQLRNRLPRKIALWALHNTNELISPSKYMIDNLTWSGLQRQNVRFIPLGIDIDVFRFEDKSLNSPVKFLHVANFNRVKDQDTLLRAFRIISQHIPCSLTIIGEGELENKIRSLSNELNLSGKVTFKQPVPNDKLSMYYHEADILLHTSISEGHPIVVEEAMSCGVLVCGTRVGLLYDLPDCCVSVDVKDYQSLASETLKLLNDPARMKMIKQNAFKWSKEHSNLWTVSELAKIYSAEK